MIVCGPDELEPTHHLTLSDGVTKVGLNLSAPDGKWDHRAIRREPMPVTSFKTTTGETKYDDYEPPYTPVSQSDWAGGMGNLDFDEDGSRYLRGWRVDASRTGQVILAPRHAYGTGYRSVAQFVPYMDGLDRVQNEFIGLYGTRFYMTYVFTAVGNYTGTAIQCWIRKRGTPPANLKAEVWSVSAGSPNVKLDGGTFSLSTLEGDTLSRMIEVEISEILSNGTSYAVVFFTDASDADPDATNCWELLCGYQVGSAGKQAADDNGSPGSWGASSYEPFFRVVSAETGVRAHWFEYKRQLYSILNYDTTQTPRLFVNGYQGVVTSAGANTLTDSTQSWATDALVGAQVELFVGEGSATGDPVRIVVSNTSTQITVDRDWDITPSTDTEYNVKGLDVWTEITGHGMTKRIRDTLSVRFNAWFAMGEDAPIRRMRRYNSAGTWTTEWADEGYQAGRLAVVENEEDGFLVWAAREGYPSTVVSSLCPYGGGVGQVLDSQQGTLTYGWPWLNDSGQDFSAWATTTGMADYLVVMTGGRGASWGYLGAASNTNQRVAVYKDRTLQTPGWNGAADVFGSTTPTAYVIFAAREYAEAKGALTVTTTTLKDAGQSLKPWEKTAGNADYMAILWDEEGLVSWGYLGAASTTGDRTINVYTDIGRTTGGWNGDSGAGTPQGFVIVSATNQDSNQATLTMQVYGLNDTSQDFSDWETRRGDALYAIIVADADGDVNWGYMGEAYAASERSIAVYRNVERTERGWMGAEVRGADDLGTPARYSVQLKADVLKFEGERINVGDTMERTTGLMAYGEPERLWVLKEGGVYNVEAGVVRRVPLRELQAVASYQNGAAVTTSNVYMVFALKNSLEKYYNSNLDDIGPMRGEGLPSTLQGVVSFVVSYPGGQVFVGIDGGELNYSSILLYNGSGYSEVYRAGIAGRRIRSGFVQALQEPVVSRLWFTEGSDLVWIPVAMNPYQEREPNQLTQRYQFSWEGALESSWHNIRLKDVPKYFQALTAFCEGLGSGQALRGDYRIDSELDDWTEMADVFDTSPVQKVLFAEPVATPGQVTYPTTGKRLQYRLRFESIYGDTTPRLLAVVLDAISRVPVKYRYNVSTRFKDEEIELQGNPETYLTLPSTYASMTTAQQLDALLAAWVNDAVVLTTECVYDLYDDKAVMLDPTTSAPIGLVFGEHEEHVVSVSLIEV